MSWRSFIKPCNIRAMTHAFLSFLFTGANGNTRQDTSLTLSVDQVTIRASPLRNSPIRFTIHKLLDAISPSYQSVFQLSLEVLVYYRCFTDIQFWKQFPSHLHVEIPPNTTQFISRTCKVDTLKKSTEYSKRADGHCTQTVIFQKQKNPLLYLHVDKLTIPPQS